MHHVSSCTYLTFTVQLCYSLQATLFVKFCHILSKTVFHRDG